MRSCRNVRPEAPILLAIVAWMLPFATVVGGCDTMSPPAGDSGRPDAAAACSTDSDCSDGLFCNGMETCAPGAVGASVAGCLAGSVPCTEAGLRCVETSDVCESDCTTPDGDGDGVDAIPCGGSDCDDTDPTRFPGNPEVCDALDQDCDPATFGNTDADGDGYVSDMCCDPTGATVLCGGDCNDSRTDVSPLASEVCGDRIDNNCDGAIDVGGSDVTWYRDRDGDMYGVPAESMMSCGNPGAGWSQYDTDCDDDRGAINPGAREVPLSGRDEDCDGRVDESSVTVRGGGITTAAPVSGAGTGAIVVRGRIEAYGGSCRGTTCVRGGIIP